MLLRSAAGAAGAVGAVGLAKLLSTGEALGQCVTTGSQTQGPFWVDEMLNRSDIRPDPATGQLRPGMPLRLSVNVSEIQGGSCSPVAGAYVDIWHCDAAGAYSDVSGGAGNPNTLGQRWLRGYQLTDAHGNARFLTIYPGWYMGRTVHIHFRVRKFSGATTTFNFTSQMYFADAISNAIYSSTAPYSSRPNRNPASNTQDMLYNPALLLQLARNGSHALASFDAVINAEVGVNHRKATPTDEDSLEHMHDFGGGTPPFALA
jgi:protocatechuate 3,4-dioxygenase beta subunit